MSGRNDAAGNVEEVKLPLRDRMPEYLVVFGIGLGVVVAVGAIYGALSSSTFTDSIGYTAILLGVIFLLAGGSTGGGYTNMSMGAVTGLFGGRGRADEQIDDPEVRRGRRPKVDPSERLRRGLRPEANPRAFWQVIGGFAYIAIGIMVVEYL